MPFTGNENHDITLHDAAELTANFRNTHPGAIKGFYYSKAAISAILSQPDCVGVRIYFGESLSVPTVPCLVIAGVKANEDDIDTGLLAEYGSPCPPHCGTGNPLNS